MKTQAWGWLAVAALAAGMNATYHAGGMQWAHALAAEVENNTSAVLALASGRADEFLAQAQLVNSRHETAPCPFAAALAQVESRVSDGDEFRAMSVENEAKLAELALNRAKIEAKLASLQVPRFSAVMVTAPHVECPRVRVSIPRLPRIHVPAGNMVHLVNLGAGPV